MLPTESSPLQRQAPSLQHRAKRAPGAVLVVAVAACGVLALRAATYRIPPAPSGATAAFTATSAPAASSEPHDASEFAASSGHVTDYASFDGVYCGTETMALSCAAAITVHNTQLRWTDKLQLAVRFTVRSAGVAPTPIWSEALEVARVDAKNTASYAREVRDAGSFCFGEILRVAPRLFLSRARAAILDRSTCSGYVRARRTTPCFVRC